MDSSLNFIRVEPREGLLKDIMGEKKLEGLLAKINSDSREEFESNIGAFMQNEEELIKQGHKGKYALFYDGKCWGILNEQEPLLSSFMRQFRNKSCYCDRIGEQSETYIKILYD